MCAVLNCAGWGLSSFQALNAWGYAAVVTAGLLLLLFWRQTVVPTGLLAYHESRILRRIRRPLPLAFLILTGMMLLGGVLYAPNSSASLTYHVPRILHWLAAGQWHWIPSADPQLNTRVCGLAWVSVPLIVFTHSDRLLFLINIVSFLLLPGLVFSVFTRLGVRPRVAWHWMWIVPTGSCFLLQAGGSGNQLFGAPLVLAALDFALRARASHRARDFFGSLLAVALMTSAGLCNLPLLLVWGVAMLPNWRLVFRWPGRLALVCVVAVGCSFLPTAALNQHYVADWTGGKSGGENVPGNPSVRLAASVLRVTLQNLVPPMRFPLAEMPIGEPAGLGFGISLLLLLSVVGGLIHAGFRFSRGQFASPLAAWQTSLRWLPLLALLAWLSLSGPSPFTGILAPYYALLLPVCLAGPAQNWVVTRCWWRTAVKVVFLMAALLLVVSPARPLFPALTLTSALRAHYPESRVLARADTIYTLYRQRGDAFAPALAELPPGLKILGLLTPDAPETSLWRPFGRRQILPVRPEATAADLKSQGIAYVLLDSRPMPGWFPEAPPAWVDRQHATIVKKIPLTLRAAEGPVDWWLVKLP